MVKLIQKSLKPFVDELIWAAWYFCLSINSQLIQKISYFSNYDDNGFMTRINDENDENEED